MNISPWRQAVIKKDVRNIKGVTIAEKGERVEARISPLTFLTGAVEVRKDGESLLVLMDDLDWPSPTSTGQCGT